LSGAESAFEVDLPHGVAAESFKAGAISVTSEARRQAATRF
jgi:hypothetical protein